MQVGPLLKPMFEAALAHTPAAPRLEESYRLLYQEQAGLRQGRVESTQGFRAHEHADPLPPFHLVRM